MSGRRVRLPSLVKGLSARLLVLTVFFVMLAEVLIYTPSVARYRKVYLEDRIGASHLATLALEVMPEKKLSRPLEDELLDHVGAYSIELKKPGVPKQLMLGRDIPPEVDAIYDLRRGSFLGFVIDAFLTLGQGENRVIRVLGYSPKDPEIFVEVILDEAPMRMAMIDYSERILVLSIVISVLTAALVYLSLQLLMVFPMTRITDNMTRFREDPEDLTKVILPSKRSDEIGVAQRALADMQAGLRMALRQRARLAALGTAVTKINHDLRNILSTARLVSDRLATLKDPQVQRIAPTLVSSIDRAVTLCAQTLDFARAEQPPNASRFELGKLVHDVGDSLGLSVGGEVDWKNAIDGDVEIEADRDQLFRVLQNLGRNAVEGGARRVEIRSTKTAHQLVIDVIDDGSGLSASAQEKLFEPFVGSSRRGGTGLGLAIARELMRAHGGDIELVKSGQDGTVFQLSIPRMRAAAE